MKKVIALLTVIILLMSGCSKGDTNSNQSTSETSDGNGSSNDDSVSEIPDSTGNKVPVIVSKNAINLSGHGDEMGYYYISDYKEDENRDSYANIMYVDYATGKEVYLCNKANCSHDSDSCASFLTLSDSDSYIFSDNGQLYLFTKGLSSSMIMGGDGTQAEIAPTIYRMNADGSDKKKLYVLESGYEVSSEDKLILLDGHLYCVLEKNELVEDSNSYIIKSTDRSLVSIDLSNGKYTSLQTIGEYQHVIGAYGEKIIFGEIKFKTELTDEQTADYTEYKRQLELANYAISSCDTSGLVGEIANIPYKECDNVIIYGNRAFYTYYGTSTIKYVDLDTMKIGTLAEGLQTIPHVMDIYDGKLLCQHWKGNTVVSYFGVDYLTGEVKDINLYDKSSNEAVMVLSDAGESLLVINGYQKKQHEVYTDQIEIKGYKFALIRKDDFFSGKSNYTQIDQEW